MPKMRFRVPVEIEVTEEEAQAARSIGEAVQKVRDSGAVQALSEAFAKTRDAVQTLRKGRRRVR